MNKHEILREIKGRSGNTSLKLPRDIQMEEADGVTTISLSAKSVIRNMQDNAAAFEGWVLCLKAVVPAWTFCLHWEKPEDTHSRHYQRFLYRISKFNEIFGGENGWFIVRDNNFLQDLRIKGDFHRYQLNSPSSGERTNDSKDSPENRLENDIVKNQPRSLKALFDIDELKRQLPMGIFEGEVSEKNAIVPHGKSAADIWGASADGSLVLFELKAEKNNQVGAISELFFYAMVLEDEQEGTFFREGAAGKIIRNTKSLKAMMLAPKTHPLITNNVFQLLNENVKDIEFGYVSINSAPPFNCKRIF